MTRLFVFDVDDTLRRCVVPGQPCPHRPGEWKLLPGVRERLSAMPWGQTGPLLGLASNQDHIGYGLLSEQTCRALMETLVDEATDGRATPRIAFCPHVPEDRCGCRKPAPGLLLGLMAEAGVAPSDTVFVGNADTDALAAARAGVRFVWAHRFFAG